MTESARSERWAAALRVPVLLALFAAPLAVGARLRPFYVPLLAVAFSVGIASWARGHFARAHGRNVPKVPGRRLLLAMHALVVFQLLPLPPALLRVLSPGSHGFHARLALEPLGSWLPLGHWRPVTVSPPDTLRGLVFLAGMTLLYATAFREFHEERWRRRLVWTVIAAGVVLSVEGLVQSQSREPTRIWGIWRPVWDWAVFGPYTSKTHFAAYLAMSIPLALGLTAEALQALRDGWARRRWLALGRRAGHQALWRASVVLALVVGLLAAQSRGGLMAFALSCLVLPLALRRGWVAGLVLLPLFGVALYWVGLTGIVQGFETRGIRASRVEMWRDQWQLVSQYPLLGAGFNAFGVAYWEVQTLNRYHWYPAAHNEYYQALLDLGVAGAALTAGLLAVLFRAAFAAARDSPLRAGLLGGLLACCFANLVDFNWQVPANAAAFVALAGLAVRPKQPDPALESALQRGPEA